MANVEIGSNTEIAHDSETMRDGETMFDYDIILSDDFKCMPWKNGLGSTLEIVRYDDLHGLRCRISQASVVNDGLFSDFSGLHRTLILLSGNGMRLQHNNKNRQHTHQLNNVLDVACFLGQDQTYASLTQGAIDDLNIMVRDVDTQATVSILREKQSLMVSLEPNQLLKAFYANTECRLCVNNQRLLNLPANSVLFIRSLTAAYQQETSCNKVYEQATQIELELGSGVFIEVSARSSY
ncbi:HutD family protein [Vibrio sp. TH_r3]|uniref:HutD/Ves family protein n=1 Tax=Vibrio sp. TH_r3 TaxID=3082084 RepID=UPI002953CF35|nr:HutD family protein [Vibrio sp. TH_r3]MDV7105607.1 HutD family protein [Vibrio sp. TH_r3]